MILSIPTALNASLMLPLQVELSAYQSAQSSAQSCQSCCALVQHHCSVERSYGGVAHGERDHLEERYSTWVTALGKHDSCFTDTVTA